MEIIMKNVNNVTIDPKCVSGNQEAFGLTNRGEVIPCCWCDTDEVRADPDYQKLLAVSNLNDYDSVDEIFLQDEWIEFIENLKNGRGFKVCYTICKKRDIPQHKAEVFIDPKTGKTRRSKVT